MIRAKSSHSITDFLKKNEIVNLNIMGFMENKPDAEIFVDDPSSIHGVLVRNGDFNFLYTDKDEVLDDILSEIIKGQGYYGFSGVHRPLTEKILQRFEKAWRNPCDLYYLPADRLDISLIRNKTCSVELKDAETIDHFYTFRNEGSLNRIREDIKERLSSAIYINNEIVSWVLMHNDNSMGIMYTREEHRNKGCAVDVTADLAAKLIEAGKTPYLQIVETNTKSPGLAVKCGFIKADACDWFGIIVN